MNRLPPDRPRARSAVPLAGALAILILAAAPARPQSAGATRASPAAEATARYLESIRADPLRVAAFLRELPKGADLHNHLSGAVYAESFLAWAAEDGRCITLGTFAATAAPCDTAAQVSAAAAQASSSLYGKVVDAWSMRQWKPAVESGHDRFFNTFGLIGAAGDGRLGDMLAEAATRAADDRVAYLELMLTPERSSVALARTLRWNGEDFAALRDSLLALKFHDRVLAEARATYDSAEAKERRLLGCAGAAATRQPGCGVEIRYLYQVSRARPPAEVFAQILAGFEVATSDARVVGLNLVQPEDAFLAMRDYGLHMRMIQFLRPLYPTVQVSLHAGELAPGLVPPAGLRFHVRAAVEVAGASRIGHGVDVLYETRPAELLREMAERNVLVEICLTSNDVILGVSGRAHPLHAYLDAGVPVALATDDEGVSRSDMTGEYQRAVLDQGLGYLELKRMIRSGLDHAFLPGASLWSDRRTFAARVPACPAGDVATAACRRYLDANPRARLEWALERDLDAFEAAHAGAATASGAR